MKKLNNTRKLELLIICIRMNTYFLNFRSRMAISAMFDFLLIMKRVKYDRDETVSTRYIHHTVGTRYDVLRENGGFFPLFL